METQTILALDLGRFNSVLCWYDPVTRVAEYRTIRSTPDDISRELTREPVGTIVFEACSQAGWVNDLCESLGLPALVASTTGSAWQWKRIKRKTTVTTLSSSLGWRPSARSTRLLSLTEPLDNGNRSSAFENGSCLNESDPRTESGASWCRKASPRREEPVRGRHQA